MNNSKKIPENQFDITHHKWGSPTLKVGSSSPFMLTLEDTTCGWSQIFIKDDGIAISKHFRLVDVDAMREFAQWAENSRQDFPKVTEALEAFIFMKTH